MHKNLRIIGPLSVVLLVAAACGGGSSDSQSPATTVSSGGSESSEPTPESQKPEDGGETGGDVSTAEVTIDGVKYAFNDEGLGTQCFAEFFGGFTATLRSEDGAGVFGVELWPDGEGGDRVINANVLITVDGVKMDLTANPEKEANWPAVEAGTSLVQSFQIDGNKATGTASFVNEEVAYDASLFPLDPIIGEFEVICGADS